MTIWTLVGALGVVFTSAQLLPQVMLSLRSRQVRDVSLGTGIIILLSALCWVIYGTYLRDWPIIIANVLNLTGASILIWLKVMSTPAR